MVGRILSSAAHRAAEAASMGALHNMRARCSMDAHGFRGSTYTSAQFGSQSKSLISRLPISAVHRCDFADFAPGKIAGEITDLADLSDFA
eukprot:6363221-Prymnesium_polylepis.1